MSEACELGSYRLEDHLGEVAWEDMVCFSSLDRTTVCAVSGTFDVNRPTEELFFLLQY